MIHILNNILKTKQNKGKGDDVMDNVRALIIKSIVSLVLLYIILGLFFGMSFGYIFVITLILGVASYYFGDIYLLPKTNNIVATISDFGLTFLVIWLMRNNLSYGTNLLTAAFIGAVGVAIFEFFFHIYLVKHFDEEPTEFRNLRYQTEASEELTPSDLNDPKKVDRVD